MSKTLRPLTRASLCATLILAAACIAFRFIGLDRPLSYDELYTVASTSPIFSFSFMMKEILMLDINAPLYNIFMHLWNLLFQPVTESSVRLPSLLASVGVLAYVWFYFPVLFSRMEKIIFFALLACSHNAIYYAQDARVYSILILAAVFILFNTVTLAGEYKKNQSVLPKKYIPFFMVGLAVCYLHYFGAALFFTCVGLLFGYAWYYKQPKLVIAVGGTAVFLAFAPWLVYIIAANPGIGQIWWAKMGSLLASEQILQMIFGNFIFAYAALLVLILGLVSSVKTKGFAFLTSPGILIPSACIVVITAFALASTAYVNLLVDRYFLVLLPCVVLLLSIFFNSLINRHNFLVVLLPPFVFLSFAWNTIDYVFAHEKYLAGTRDATRHIVHDIRPPKFLVYLEGIPYPPPAMREMFNFYIQRENSAVTQEKLSAESLKTLLQKDANPIILMPVCSKLAMLNMVAEFELFPLTSAAFNQDSCVVRTAVLENLNNE